MSAARQRPGGSELTSSRRSTAAVHATAARILAFGRGRLAERAEFAAALNCGVLEHVDDERRALAELRRVLRPGALLFTYHLPNRHAWTEWLGRRLGRFHHDRTYSWTEAVDLFQAGGFRVVGIRP